VEDYHLKKCPRSVDHYTKTDAGVTSYVVYNYSDQSRTVTFSDGVAVEAPANAFAIKQR